MLPGWVNTLRDERSQQRCYTLKKLAGNRVDVYYVYTAELKRILVSTDCQ